MTWSRGFHLRTLSNLSVLPLAIAAAVVPATSASAADDWSRFRGANGSGVIAAAPLPPEWTAEQVSWRATLPARGHSSPAVWGGLLVVTAADPPNGRRHVLGIDAADGKTRWAHQGDGPVFRQHADNSFASATPALDAERVYVAWLAPERSRLEAYDHAGKALWSVDLGSFIAQHGAGASPIVVDDLVVLPFEQDGPGDSYVLAVDAKTGKERWRLPRISGKLACSTPSILRPASAAVQLICTSSNHGIYAIEVTTGKELWSFPKAFTQRCVASPVIASGLIFASDGQGGKGTRLIAVRPPATPGDEPELVWQLSTGAPYVPCVAVRDDQLFLITDGGHAACLAATTGKELWRQPLGVGTFYSSPVIVGERLYAVSRRGEVVCLSASATFARLGTSLLGEGAFSTPAIANGRMYLRTFTGVMAVGEK